MFAQLAFLRRGLASWCAPKFVVLAQPTRPHHNLDGFRVLPSLDWRGYDPKHERVSLVAGPLRIPPAQRNLDNNTEAKLRLKR